MRILPLADLHLGDPLSEYQKIQEYIRFIKDNNNVFTILNGDLMDTATRNSIGDVFNGLNPMEQLRECVALFEPIKDKVLAVNPGNHERRVSRETSVDMTEMMCAQLKIADRYSAASSLLFIRFGKHARCQHGRPVCYTLYCVHGSANGRTEGGKLNRLAQLASICDADIYLMSHTHLPAIMRTGFYRVSASNNSVAKIDKLYINTASTLNYGGYGELQSYKPTSIEMPMIVLDGTKRGMKAIL